MIGTRGRAATALMLAAILCSGAGQASSPTADAPRLAPGQPIPPAELEAFVDGVVRESMAHDHVAGVTVAVVQDGQVILKKGYGYADVDLSQPVDPDRTLSRLGSISKTFTWLMMLKAIDEGRMRLDAPVNAYLPPKVRVPDQGFSRPIRLRDLMTHTPGFDDQVLGYLFARDASQLRPLDDALSAHRPRRVAEPGDMPAYSNYGAALAGDAVAHVNGALWQDLIETEILNPAGLAHTTVREPYAPRTGLPAPMPPDLARDRSVGYRWSGVSFLAQPYEYVGNFAPAGAMSSSAGDMARYMTLLLAGGVIDGRVIYGPATAAAIRTPMIAFPGGGGVDAGFFQFPLPGGFIGYGHDGATLDFNSAMVLVPDLKLGMFLAANTEDSAAIVHAAPGLIVSRFYGPPPAELPPAPALLKEASRYGGEFISTRRRHDGLEGFLLGVRTLPMRVAAPGYLVIGAPGAALRLVPTGESGWFQSVDPPHERARIVFEHGRATRVLLAPPGRLERVDVFHESGTLNLAALAAVVTSAAVLLGLFSGARWKLPQTGWQRLAGRLRAGAAALWLTSGGLFAIVVLRALADQSSILYVWPGPMMLAASSVALAAALVSIATLAVAPLALAGRGGWTTLRKIRFGLTSAVLGLFGLLLALLGALQPWNP